MFLFDDLFVSLQEDKNHHASKKRERGTKIQQFTTNSRVPPLLLLITFVSALTLCCGVCPTVAQVVKTPQRREDGKNIISSTTANNFQSAPGNESDEQPTATNNDKKHPFFLQRETSILAGATQVVVPESAIFMVGNSGSAHGVQTLAMILQMAQCGRLQKMKMKTNSTANVDKTPVGYDSASAFSSLPYADIIDNVKFLVSPFADGGVEAMVLGNLALSLGAVGLHFSVSMLVVLSWIKFKRRQVERQVDAVLLQLMEEGQRKHNDHMMSIGHRLSYPQKPINRSGRKEEDDHVAFDECSTDDYEMVSQCTGSSEFAVSSSSSSSSCDNDSVDTQPPQRKNPPASSQHQPELVRELEMLRHQLDHQLPQPTTAAADAICRFPSLSLQVCSFLYSGVLFATVFIVLHLGDDDSAVQPPLLLPHTATFRWIKAGDATIAVRLVIGFIGFVWGVAFPILLVVGGNRATTAATDESAAADPSPHHLQPPPIAVFITYDEIAGNYSPFLRHTLIPNGKWFPPHWTKRYGKVFSAFRPGHVQRIVGPLLPLLLQVVTACLVNIGLLMNGDDDDPNDHCGPLYLTLSSLHAVGGVVVFFVAPSRFRVFNVLDLVGYILLAVVAASQAAAAMETNSAAMLDGAMMATFVLLVWVILRAVVDVLLEQQERFFAGAALKRRFLRRDDSTTPFAETSNDDMSPAADRHRNAPPLSFEKQETSSCHHQPLLAAPSTPSGLLLQREESMEMTNGQSLKLFMDDLFSEDTPTCDGTGQKKGKKEKQKIDDGSSTTKSISRSRNRQPQGRTAREGSPEDDVSDPSLSPKERMELKELRKKGGFADRCRRRKERQEAAARGRQTIDTEEFIRKLPKLVDAGTSMHDEQPDADDGKDDGRGRARTKQEDNEAYMLSVL